MCRVGSQPTRGLCHPRASGKPAFSPRPPANWVRFAQSHSGGASRPGLPAPIPGRAGQIGFVLHTRRSCHAPGAPSHPARRANWVRFAHLPGVPRPCGHVPPDAPGIGFVLHINPPPGPNWVRFARPSRPGYAHTLFKEPDLRSFLPFTNWVRFARFTPRPATPHTTPALAHIPHSTQVWLCSAQFPSSAASGRAELGSFCAFRLRHASAAGPNWLRSAHSPSGTRSRAARLGLFCAFCLRPLWLDT
jgi:hypothetical protein